MSRRGSDRPCPLPSRASAASARAGRRGGAWTRTLPYGRRSGRVHRRVTGGAAPVRCRSIRVSCASRSTRSLDSSPRFAQGPTSHSPARCDLWPCSGPPLPVTIVGSEACVDEGAMKGCRDRRAVVPGVGTVGIADIMVQSRGDGSAVQRSDAGERVGHVLCLAPGAATGEVAAPYRPDLPLSRGSAHVDSATVVKRPRPERLEPFRVEHPVVLGLPGAVYPSSAR